MIATMKYQPAAILLATAAASSVMMESDGLDTTLSKHTSNQRQLMPMYGYCIGCVALVTTTTHNNIDNTEFTTTAITPSLSSSTGKNGVLSSNSSGSALEHAGASSCSETRLFLPTPKKKNTSTSEQHFFQSSSSTAINLHQLNLILLSRSIHNNNRGFGEQQPFLSDIFALSLFLVAVAIGIAWGGSSANDNKKKKKEDERDDNEHEYDLISRRLVYDEFFDICLVPTIDDDDDEEEDNEEKNVQEQEQQEKVEKEATNDTSVLSPLVGDIIKPQRTLTLPSHDHEQQEWKKPPLFRPTVDDEDETSTVTTQEEALIAGYRKYLPKSRKKNTKVVKKSILTIRSPSHTECVSTATPKVTTTKKRVSFHKDVRVKVIPPDDDEEASISSSSSSSTTTKKRKGLFKLHKLSLGNLCEMKSREYVPLRE